MTVLDTAKSVVSHRGISCLELHRKLGELTRQVGRLTIRAEQATNMEARLDEQARTINSLREQLTSAKTIRDDIHIRAGQHAEAEAKAAAAERALAEQSEELTALRAFRDNVNAVSVPTGERDIDPGDHPTEPQGIDVRTLREAADAGLLRPVTDPGRIH